MIHLASKKTEKVGQGLHNARERGSIFVKAGQQSSLEAAKLNKSHRVARAQSKKKERAEALKQAADQRRNLDELQQLLENARRKYEIQNLWKKSPALRREALQRLEGELEGEEDSAFYKNS